MLENVRASVILAVIVFVESAVLEHCNLLAKRALELNHTGMILVETPGFFDTLDVGSERFSQVDCGEHLHRCTYDVPTVLPLPEVSVGDIRHSSSNESDRTTMPQARQSDGDHACRTKRTVAERFFGCGPIRFRRECAPLQSRGRQWHR